MKSNRKTLAIVFGVVAIGGTTSLAMLQNSGPTMAPQQNKFEQGIREKTGKATPIQEGVMTEKQKRHSKIFKRFEIVTAGKKLRDIATDSGDVYVVRMVGDVKIPRSLNLNEYLSSLTCRASAVVMGTVMSKTSQLIDEGTFTFTDYELTVTEILKNNLAAPIEPNGRITYTSPGGAVELNGRTIGAVDYRSEPLQVGEQYLLYVNFIPDTGSYKGFSDDVNGDTFALNNGVISQLSKKPLPLGTKRTTDAAGFMAGVRAAANQQCSN